MYYLHFYFLCFYVLVFFLISLYFFFYFFFLFFFFFFFSSRRRHTRCGHDWSSDVCSSDLIKVSEKAVFLHLFTIAIHTKPIGFSGVAPVGPAIPEVAIAQSELKIFKVFWAISRTVS